MEVSGSEESDESLDDSDASSKSDESWSIGSNKAYFVNFTHSRKKKRLQRNVFKIRSVYSFQFNYESFRSCWTSHNNKKDINNQTDLVPITFGVLISKERNSEKRSTNVKILMDSGASASIIHKSYVSKNNFITRKSSANQWSSMAGSFSTSHKAEITLKMPELDVTAHISAPFHLTTKKNNYDVFLGKFYLGN